jgi:hypothetical protein
MMDIHKAHVHKQVDESDIMANIVERWSDCIKRVNKNSNKSTVLCFDSHYMDAVSRTVLIDKKQQFIGAVSTGRFGKVFDIVKHDVKKPGDFSLAYTPKTGELFNYHWDKNKDIGKKMVLGNAMLHFSEIKQPKHSIPLYDEYSICFSACDNFNKSLCGKMWPHKKGGKYCLGDQGKQDDFAFTCILFNAFFAYKEINKRIIDFEAFCIELADALYEYTCP